MRYTPVVTVDIYRTAGGKQPFSDWLRGLRDKQARARIRTRIARLALGNFGDCEGLGSGLLELRIDYGPGYRVYMARRGEAVVLLLCGGDKRRQRQDIERARAYLKEYEQRIKS